MNKKVILAGVAAGLSLCLSASGWVVETSRPTTQNEEITLLITKYRNGDSQAAHELIERFRPLIRKYWMALWLGKVSDTDQDLGRFLSFFHRDRRTAAELLSKSLRKGEVEDLDQILVLALLKTALKFNVISAGYKYVLKQEICELTKDLSTHRTTQNWGLWNGRGTNGFSAPLNMELIGNAKTDAALHNFCLEGSDIPGFDELSLKERELIRMAYIEDKQNSDIAQEMNLTVRQVRRLRQKIREKINKGLSC